MKLPSYHSFFYNGHQIIYLNGPYKIADIPCLPSHNLNYIKAKVDEYERLNEPKFFDNEKSTNAKTKICD